MTSRPLTGFSVGGTAEACGRGGETGGNGANTTKDN